MHCIKKGNNINTRSRTNNILGIIDKKNKFLTFSPNIISVIKSRMMNWARHAAHMGKIKEFRQGFVVTARMKETSRKIWA
jgi:ribosomal protein L14E/L6E/L27E